MKIIIRQLKKSDKQLVLDLIAADNLRPEGILEKGTRYWGAFVEDRLVGIIGLECENNYGLLRSAFVHTQFRKMGIAGRLTRVLFQEAKDAKLETIYLFSTDAGGYWIRLGFEKAAVAEVVEKLADAPQVKLFEKLGWLPTEAAYKIDLTDL